MEMYFIALVAPSDIEVKVAGWKRWMFDRYQCRVALKSPAHITLIPPFWMSPDTETAICSTLDHCGASLAPFQVALQDFAAFPPRVIYVSVLANEVLNHCRSAVERCLQSNSQFPVKTESRPFTPHVTIATRDLHKRDFLDAWEHFREKRYEASWPVNEVSILRLEQKKWDVIHTSQLHKVG